MLDKYIIAIHRAMDNEQDRINRKGTRSVATTNRRKGFLEGLEHALQIYKIFKEDYDG